MANNERGNGYAPGGGGYKALKQNCSQPQAKTSRDSKAHNNRHIKGEGIEAMSNDEYEELSQSAKDAMKKGREAINDWNDVKSLGVYLDAAREWKNIREQLRYRVKYEEFKKFCDDGEKW